MKVSKHLFAVLLGGIALSCSKHDGNPIETNGEATWVSISLGKNKTYGSVANSTNAEKKINAVDIFLFTPDPTPANSVLAKHVSFVADQLTQTGNGQATEAFQTTTAEQYMVVIVNAPAAYKAAITAKGAALKLGDFTTGDLSTLAVATLSDFSNDYANVAPGSESFMMVNTNPTSRISFPLQHDRGALNPFPVQVERIVSKVEVWCDDNISTTNYLANNTAIDAVNPVGTAIQKIDVLLDNQNKKSFVLPNLGTSGNPLVPVFVDPNYQQVLPANTANEFFASIPDGTSQWVNIHNGASLATATPFYCFENTIEQDHSVATKFALESNATNLILRMQLNGGSDFYMTKKGELTTNGTHPDGIWYTYTGGYCYYRIYIKRPGISIIGSNPATDEYGMERNRLYEVNIKEIRSVGSSTVAALKDKPILTGSLLNVDIQVKDWVLQSNDIIIP